MATQAAIPACHHKDMVRWWSDGISTRKIAELLHERGVDVHDTTVWRMIQRITENNGNQEAALAVSDARRHAEDDVNELFSIENRILDAASPDATPYQLKAAIDRIRLLESAHRLRCNRLRVSGVFGKAGDKLHQNLADFFSGMADEDDRCKEEKARNREAAKAAAAPAPSHAVLHMQQPKLLENEEIRCSSPPVAATDSIPPARTRPCPCGSGRKFKHCCADRGPGAMAREARAG